MKFLVFNITVAAALIYLLTTDRAQVQSTAGRIHDAATEMKQAAGRVVDRGRSLVGVPSAGTPPRPPSSSDLTDTAAAKPVPVMPDTAAAIPPIPSTTAAPALQLRDVDASTGTPHRDPPATSVGSISPAPAAKSVPSVRSAKEAAALRRRAEILQGIDPAVLAPKSKQEPEAVKPALTAAERRKQLYALSEEMELFYARTLGQ